jgi:DNA-binding CsgD family transcriptional regulator
MLDKTDYRIFFEFIKNYSANGFREIENYDHFMVRLNRVLDSSRQFFYIADLTKLQLIYTSPQVADIFGLEPEKFDLSYNFKYTHPFDIRRRSRVRAKVIETGQELFINKSGYVVISSTFTMKKFSGEYVHMLVQCYLFYSNLPLDTVYILLISTPIDKFSKILKRGHYHWYEGNDMNYFRYPDEELLLTGSNLTDRELEILMYIHKGMETKEIGDKLYLSPHTVSTHRRNILKKSGKSSIGEVIYELEGIGML